MVTKAIKKRNQDSAAMFTGAKKRNKASKEMFKVINLKKGGKAKKRKK